MTDREGPQVPPRRARGGHGLGRTSCPLVFADGAFTTTEGYQVIMTACLLRLSEDRGQQCLRGSIQGS
jgi:hypothetical protein